ncbi:MAG TPA: MgtC/SapB family protein [Armatimonadota bacterium]|nr:MgtC/SapB family protein [Armatimonadota bacterium]HQK93120.1 MgtC/SapB family protein [Armatimonadota bacterium]
MPSFPSLDEATTALRLAAAIGLCGVIGLERQLHRQSAGFRTHILVGVGACLVMMLSIIVGGADHDPGRIAAQVVTGVGFLGAGTIIRQRDSIRGLTTAASVWCASAVGLAAGAGWFQGAAMATAGVLISLWLFKFIELHLPADDARIVVVGEACDETEAAIRSVVERRRARVVSSRRHHGPDGRDWARVVIAPRRASDVDALHDALESLDRVDRVRVTSSRQ